MIDKEYVSSVNIQNVYTGSGFSSRNTGLRTYNILRITDSSENVTNYHPYIFCLPKGT